MKTTTVHISDDLGGAGQASTVNFSFNGVEYEIDLNKRNRETFERHMQRWIDGGREVQVKAVRVPSYPKTTTRDDTLFKARVGEVAAFIASTGQMPRLNSSSANERRLATFINNSRAAFRGTGNSIMSDKRKDFINSSIPGWHDTKTNYEGFTA